MDSVATDAGTASGGTAEGQEQGLKGAVLDEEADRVAGAGRYERSADRQDTRAGSYRRKLQTKAGEVELKVPRLRKLPLETAIIERRVAWASASLPVSHGHANHVAVIGPPPRGVAWATLRCP